MYFSRLTLEYIFIMMPFLIFAIYFLARAAYMFRREQRRQNMYNYRINKILFYTRLSLFSIWWLLLFLAYLWPNISWLKDQSGISSDVVFVLDLSQSMDAEDFSINEWTFSRLEAAKRIIAEFVASNKNDSFSLVGFSWEAVLISPLTNDPNTFLSFLSSINTKTLSKWWTDIRWALKLALWSDKDRNRNIVILSDWEDLTWDNWFSEIWIKPDSKRFKVFALWIWEEKWSYIPDWEDMFWHRLYKMYDQKRVVSRLEEDSLISITKMFSWIYKKATSINDAEYFKNYLLPSIYDRNTSKDEVKDAWYLFLFAAFVIIVIWYLFDYRQIIWRKI